MNNSPVDEDLLKEKLTPDEIKAIHTYTETHRIFQIPVLGSYPTTLTYRNLEKNQAYKIGRLHHGQRKLMLTEVLYLSMYGNLSNTVVYAGAAPGTHILLLMDLFPRHKFILWDPVKFDRRLEKIQSNNLELHNEYFTNDSANIYTGQNVIFISDIRSEVKGFEAFEAGVHNNNIDQKNWIQIMNPVISSLKFRIPFTHKGPYLYLDGVVYMQPWAPEFSAETRLVTYGKNERFYDPVLFENELYYYNNIVREFGHFPHQIDTNLVEGLCHCNDCCYEIHIWKIYLNLMVESKMSDEDIKRISDLMCRISAITNKSLRMANHGLMPDIPMMQKRRQLVKKHYKKV